MSSIAQYDHHAVMINSVEGYYAIPYEVWNYSAVNEGDDILVEGAETPEPDTETEPVYDTGVLLFKTGDKIGSVDRHALSSSGILRSVYIGEWVYALDGDGEVQSFRPEF
jgi:hypothetical protein